MTDDPQNTITPYRYTLLLPLLVASLLCALSFLLWWGLAGNERAKQHETISLHARTLAADIESDLRSRIPSLQRMVRRWVYHGGSAQEEFVIDAEAYVADMPGFQAIEWVDRDFIVRRVIPLWGNEKVVGLNLAFEENRRAALDRAKARHAPTTSRPIDLVQGGKGFLLYLPIYLGNEFDGFILAAFETKSWLEYVLRVNDRENTQDEFTVLVSMSGVPIFELGRWKIMPETGAEASSEVSFLDQTFTVACRPTASFYRVHSTPLPQIAAGAGVFLSILVGFMVHLYQKAVHEKWKTQAARRAIEVEVSERKKTAGQMERLSTRLTLATRAGRIGVWEWDVKSGQLTWDERMFELYDIPPDVVPKYETWRNALHPDDAQAAETLLQDAVRGKALFDTQFRIVLSDGSIRHIHAAARANRDAEGNPVCMTGVNWDVTQLKQAETDLQRERWKLSSIIKGTNVGTWEWNIQTGETAFNDRWAGIIGYTLEELSPVSIDTWIKHTHPDDLKISGELLERHFKGELDYYECEARMRHRNGEWVWVLDRGKVASWTEDGKPLLMYGTHMDITAQKNAEETIRHLATHDTLTGLPSLSLARDRIDMALASARRNKTLPALLFVDLDGFKSINDSLGHAAGDKVLMTTAKRLLACVREVDTVARIGGDEFLVVATELGEPKDAAVLAGKIVEVVSEPLSIGEVQATVGASVGIALCSGSCHDIDDFIRRADAAMYGVKKSGKNGFAFDQGFVSV